MRIRFVSLLAALLVSGAFASAQTPSHGNPSPSTHPHGGATPNHGHPGNHPRPGWTPQRHRSGGNYNNPVIIVDPSTVRQLTATPSPVAPSSKNAVKSKPNGQPTPEVFKSIGN